MLFDLSARVGLLFLTRVSLYCSCYQVLPRLNFRFRT